MEAWRPITADELQSLVDEQLRECTSAQRQVFERYRVPLYAVPIERYSRSEAVFVVAQNEKEVMYYDDVEHGFNFSLLTDHGCIALHSSNQDELRYSLNHWLGGTEAYFE